LFRVKLTARMQLGAIEDNKYLYVNAGNIVSIVHTKNAHKGSTYMYICVLT